MKIAVFGLGRVGPSNAVLPAYHSEVAAVDITDGLAQMLNVRKSLIVNAGLKEFSLFGRRTSSLRLMPKRRWWL
jgi:UDP-glucose 6-dehydrogenase